MELVLNDQSMDGQFETFEQFEDCFVERLNPLFEVIADKNIPLYKVPEMLQKPLIGEWSLNDILRMTCNNAVASLMRKWIIQMMDNPYLYDGEIMTSEETEYDYPVELEEPNCFTEAIERYCPLLSFPHEKYTSDIFECRKNGRSVSVHNVKEIKGLLNVYLTENISDMKYVLEKYPYEHNVKMAEYDKKCWAEDAICECGLSEEDILKVYKNIPQLIEDKSNGRKSHWWDHIEGDINEYRVTVSDNREFRLLFLWKEKLIFLNGFIKKTRTTPENEKQRAREIIKKCNC